MPVPNEIVAIADSLLPQSRAGSVPWTINGQDSYIVLTSGGSVVISQTTGSGGTTYKIRGESVVPPFVTISVFNADGVEVETGTVGQGHEWVVAFQELWSLARHRALRISETLDSVHRDVVSGRFEEKDDLPF